MSKRTGYIYLGYNYVCMCGWLQCRCIVSVECEITWASGERGRMRALRTYEHTRKTKVRTTHTWAPVCIRCKTNFSCLRHRSQLMTFSLPAGYLQLCGTFALFNIWYISCGIYASSTVFMLPLDLDLWFYEYRTFWTRSPLYKSPAPQKNISTCFLQKIKRHYLFNCFFYL